MCQGILELWCRGQLQTHHVRFLLRELMSIRLMEEVGDGQHAPERRIASEPNSCFIARKFAQGTFEPSFSEVDQYWVKAPLSSADSIFDLLWLHRKQGLHVVMDVVQLALNHRGGLTAALTTCSSCSVIAPAPMNNAVVLLMQVGDGAAVVIVVEA